MLNQMTFLDTPNAISSPGSEDGAERFDSLIGPTRYRFGQDHVPANRSVVPAQGGGQTILATSGPSSSSSSRPSDLSSLLENRLRQRLLLYGSMEYVLTWKVRTTPMGRSIYALRGSTPRTLGNDCTGWPTPKALTGGANSQRSERGAGGADLQEAAGWATPQATEARQGFQDRSRGMKGNQESPTTQVINNVPSWVSAWPTPRTRDHKGEYEGGRIRNGKISTDTLDVAAQLTSGPNTSSSPAETENTDASSQESRRSSGSLNPALPRWLMGYPVEWCEAAIAAFRKIKATAARLAPSEIVSLHWANATGEGRVMRLKGYGNAINPVLASEFVVTVAQIIESTYTAKERAE